MGHRCCEIYRLACLPKEVGLKYNDGFQCSLSDAGRKFMVVPDNELDRLRSHNHRKTLLVIKEIESDDD